MEALNDEDVTTSKSEELCVKSPDIGTCNSQTTNCMYI